jgi:hypothetical protein
MEASSENSADPYAVVLADLEGQRARIDAAIAAIKALQSGTPIRADNLAQVGPTSLWSSTIHSIGWQLQMVRYRKLGVEFGG